MMKVTCWWGQQARIGDGLVGHCAYVEPVDVLVPVRLCEGGLGDVWLLWVVLGIAVGLRDGGHGGWLLNVLWVDGLHARDRLVGGHCAKDGVLR